MKRLSICLPLILFAFPALASVTISKEYLFTPTLWEKVETGLKQAAARDPEMQKYPIFFSIESAEGIALWCPPHSPKITDGTGCFLNFLINTNSFSLTIKKGLALTFSSQQISDQIKAHDPNTTEDHLHFGSPFVSTKTFGSHYYCQPEGGNLNKKWQCYLFISESFGG